MIGRRLLPLAATLLCSTFASAQPVARIAIIIDDLGYQLEAGRRAISLPGPVSYAILPLTPYSRLLARTAHDQGREILLHLPLESVDHGNTAEPGVITLDMDRNAFHRDYVAALESVPYAAGVSTHRGSLLTRHPGHMRWLMEEIAAREGMFFVDSYTTAQSVALQVAAESGIAATRRHVFLDNDRRPAAIGREFERLIVLAGRQGVAVAIGHPYPETLDFLEHRLAGLNKKSVELIPVSEAVNFVELTQASELQDRDDSR